MSCEARMIQGDCLQVLPTLPADRFHCVVTSVPYWMLRSYLPTDHPLKPLEIGSEPTPEAFIETMVKVFREVRRVMHPTGLLFLNLGDSYGAGTTAPRKPGYGKHGYWNNPNIDKRVTAGLAAGQLLNMPHRVAEALRADGWLWRQTIIWAKRSPMPESVRGWRFERCRVKVEGTSPGRDRIGALDGERARFVNHSGTVAERVQYVPCPGCPKCSPHGGYVLRKGKGRCTTAHEYIFVMSKSPVYFWDSAVFVEESTNRASGNKRTKLGYEAGRDGTSLAHRSVSIATEATPFRNPRSVWLLRGEGMYRLRSDLTPEQREYVLRRIAGVDCR